MISKRIFLLSLVLTFIIAWTAGYLRLPFTEKGYSFLLGSASASALVMLILMLRTIFRKDTSSIDASSGHQNTPNKNKEFDLCYMIIACTILFICLVSLVSLYQSNVSLKEELDFQKQKLKHYAESLDASRKSKSYVLLNDILKTLERDIDLDPQRRLSDKTIDKLKAVNYSFEPYKILENDSFSEKKWSPERGQLLLSLIAMKMDPASFKNIKDNISFEYAYLKHAYLNGLDLSGIDLKNANLSGADLRSSIIDNSDLSDAELDMTKMSKASIQNSRLHRVNLEWADLSESIIRGSDLNGSNISNAKLGKADLRAVRMEWAKAANVYLRSADLLGSVMTGTDLEDSNLSKANFSKVNMHLVNFSGAVIDSCILDSVVLTKATVLEEDWIQKLRHWNVYAADEIERSYRTTIEISGKYNYRLVKK